jgi:hypothetical protein
MRMNKEIDEHKIQELKEMLQTKKRSDPVEKTLAIFCERHGISIETCRVYYDKLLNEEVEDKK